MTTAARDLYLQMGAGWNIGNSLDAVGGETAWGNPLVTQQVINAVADAGFKTLRVPVAWSQFSNSANFTISSTWMSRVEQVVNYGLSRNMFVIINMHWDGGWMKPTNAEQAYVTNRMTVMWTQIANHFKNYGHKLMFAGTNEVMVEGDYGTPTYEYYTVQNGYNQTFVNTVRATGGNNASRYLVFQTFNTNIDHGVSFATVPTDSATDRLLVEMHFYDPYTFTLDPSSAHTQWGAIATNSGATAGWGNEDHVNTQMTKFKNKFGNLGMIMGEYGVEARPNVSGHLTYHEYWMEYVTAAASANRIVPVVWDNGYLGSTSGMALFNRNTGAEFYPTVIDAVIDAAN
jgi:endoglucanase